MQLCYIDPTGYRTHEVKHVSPVPNPAVLQVRSIICVFTGSILFTKSGYYSLNPNTIIKCDPESTSYSCEDLKQWHSEKTQRCFVSPNKMSHGVDDGDFVSALFVNPSH